MMLSGPRTRFVIWVLLTPPSWCLQSPIGFSSVAYYFEKPGLRCQCCRWSSQCFQSLLQKVLVFFLSWIQFSSRPHHLRRCLGSSCGVDWTLWLLPDFSTFALFSLFSVFIYSLWVCCGLPRSVCSVCVTSSVLYQEDPLSSQREMMESSENVSDRISAVRRGIIIQNRKWSAIHQNTQSIGLLLSSLQGFTGRSYGAESGRGGGSGVTSPRVSVDYRLCDSVWSLPQIYYITTPILHLGTNSCVNTSDHPPEELLFGHDE